MTRIKAPVSGTVDQVYLKLGQSTAMGMPAVRVVNFNDLRVVTDQIMNAIHALSGQEYIDIYAPKKAKLGEIAEED